MKDSFSAVDYVLFVSSLVFSASIGIYYAWKGGKTQTTKEVLLGNKKLGILPVAMSLVATFMSAISLLGYPAEIYQFGTMFCYYGLMYWIAFPLSAYIVLPVFYNLQLTSAYHYLELRFDYKVRLAASVIFCLQITLYLSVVLYAPALALSSVTPISVSASILTTGLVCTFYTSLGGAKAVVWTNAYQFLLIIVGLLAVVIGGAIQLDGIGNAWVVARRGGRIDFSDFRPDPTVRHSFWSLVVGGTFTLLTLYSANQMTVQRYISMPTLKNAQIALLLNAPLNTLIIVLYSLAGLIMYAVYSDCDPKSNGSVSKADQILPYFVINKLGHLTGLPGLFISAIYGAGLSTLAAGYNALAAVVLEDFVKPIYRWKTRLAIKDEKAASLTKFIALFCGIVTIGFAFLFTLIKSTVLQVALSIFGIGGGPILGVFLLGMLTPWPNARGALFGLLVSIVFVSWIGFSPIFYGLRPSALPFSTEGCTNSSLNSTQIISDFENSTIFTSSQLIVVTSEPSGGLMELYKLSYQYYSLVAVIIVFVVGVAGSAVCGGFNKSDCVDRKLLIPLHEKFCCCLPEAYRQHFRLGAEPTVDDVVSSKPLTGISRGDVSPPPRFSPKQSPLPVKRSSDSNSLLSSSPIAKEFST